MKITEKHIIMLSAVESPLSKPFRSFPTVSDENISDRKAPIFITALNATISITG